MSEIHHSQFPTIIDYEDVGRVSKLHVGQALPGEPNAVDSAHAAEDSHSADAEHQQETEESIDYFPEMSDEDIEKWETYIVKGAKDADPTDVKKYAYWRYSSEGQAKGAPKDFKNFAKYKVSVEKVRREQQASRQNESGASADKDADSDTPEPGRTHQSRSQKNGRVVEVRDVTQDYIQNYDDTPENSAGETSGDVTQEDVGRFFELARNMPPEQREQLKNLSPETLIELVRINKKAWSSQPEASNNNSGNNSGSGQRAEEDDSAAEADDDNQPTVAFEAVPASDDSPRGRRHRVWDTMLKAHAWSRVNVGSKIEDFNNYFEIDDRKIRNRRRAAGAVAGAVVLAGTSLVAYKLLGHHPQPKTGKVPGLISSQPSSSPRVPPLVSPNAHPAAHAVATGNLARGSNPWNFTEHSLEQRGVHDPSKAQILQGDEKVGRAYMKARHLGRFTREAWSRIAKDLPSGTKLIKP